MDMAAWASTAIALLGGAATYGAVRQEVKSLRSTVDKMDERNREDHGKMFDKIDAEAAKRESEDKDLRNQYVTLATESVRALQTLGPVKGHAAHAGGD